MIKIKKMNRPLMFMNNNLIVEQLKTAVWEKYKEIRACDFQGWYEGLSPIEKTAWDVKFDEIQENERN
tara:strand:+ start:658 stop:861 length:204 start_codon:yes stop_codon:yes gene_type:complete